MAMTSSRLLLLAGVALAGLPAPCRPASAQPATQSGPGWFVPQEKAGAPQAAAPRASARGQRSAPRPAPQAVPMAANAAPPMPDEAPLPPVPLPPVPDLPALPRVAPPPAAVIGVLGVPDVMRNSDAAKAVEAVIKDRRDRLNADAQKELTTEREAAQAIANDRGKASPDQLRAREQALRERAAAAQKQFRDRNRVVQQAAQYALSQIERTLIAVIRQVSESHGMNLVMHRAQVALNVNDFDITQPVTVQLNKVLPSVQVPPDGVTVQDYLAKQKAASPAATPSVPPAKP